MKSSKPLQVGKDMLAEVKATCAEQITWIHFNRYIAPPIYSPVGVSEKPP